MNTHVDAPSERCYGSAYDWILVDGDDFGVLQNFEGLVSYDGKLKQRVGNR
jgi:hypothetical protein